MLRVAGYYLRVETGERKQGRMEKWKNGKVEKWKTGKMKTGERKPEHQDREDGLRVGARNDGRKVKSIKASCELKPVVFSYQFKVTSFRG